MKSVEQVYPNEAEVNEALIGGKTYKIYFTALHGQHVCQNYNNDELHKITHTEIVSGLRKSLLVQLKENTQNFVSLFEFKNKIWEAHVKVMPGRSSSIIEIKTAYKCNKIQLIELMS